MKEYRIVWYEGEEEKDLRFYSEAEVDAAFDKMAIEHPNRAFIKLEMLEETKNPELN